MIDKMRGIREGSCERGEERKERKKRGKNEGGALLYSHEKKVQLTHVKTVVLGSELGQDCFILPVWAS